MIWLVLSVLASSGVFLMFKIIGTGKADTFHAIVFNYLTAFLFGAILIAGKISMADLFSRPWFIPGLLLGLVFISIFYLMAITAQKFGVSVSTVAAKLSFCLPVLIFVALIPNESLGWIKIIGIVLAVCGVVLSSLKPGQHDKSWQLIVLPLVIFVGSGLIDLIFGWYANDMRHTGDEICFATLPFFTAAMAGSLIMIIGMLRGKRLNGQSISGGILLGVINFGSIFFLIKALGDDGFQKSAIIPANNLGIVLLSSLLSWIIFKELFSMKNKLGLLISAVSIILFLIA